MSTWPWDWVYVHWYKGENIAILGARGTGKTTLYNYLTDTHVDRPPEQGLAPERKGWNKNNAVGLSLREGYDVPGGEANLRDWETEFSNAAKVFYLFDAYQLRLNTDNHQVRVRDDGRALRDWSEGAKSKRIMLIGTHSDLDPMAEEIPAHQYQDEIMDLDVIQAFVGRTRARGHAIGSLTSKAKAESLVRRALAE